MVKQIVNSIFTSNTYIISKERSDIIWLVDAGNIEGVFDSLDKNNYIKGVFITHPHFDHIYGINKLVKEFPECIVFTSNAGRLGLSSSKLNLSFYHEDPIEFVGENVHTLNDKSKIELYDNIYIEIFETPGHNWGCLSFRVGNYIFTGDSFIPNVDVVTKLKGGDKEASNKSVKKIMDIISENTIICPGHGKMIYTHNIKGFLNL